MPLQLHTADEAQGLLCSGALSDAIVATDAVEDPLADHVHRHADLALQGALRFPERKKINKGRVSITAGYF